MESEFEYTVPGTPQQNGHIEWKFSTLLSGVYAMLNGGIFSVSFRNGLWAKVVITTTFLKNNLITPNRDLCQFQQIFKEGKVKHTVFSANIL